MTANSYVTLGGDFLGFGSAGAYGVGNQAIVSNVGSDTVMDVTQDNAGDISANAAFAAKAATARSPPPPPTATASPAALCA